MKIISLKEYKECVKLVKQLIKKNQTKNDTKK